MNTAEQYRINKLKSLKTGDTVYLVPTNPNPYIRPCIRKIISLGNKWLKVDYLHRSENKFDVTDNYKHTPDLGSADYELHASEEDYKIFCDMCEEHFKLLQQIDILKINSNIDTLKKVVKKWNRLINKQSC